VATDEERLCRQVVGWADWLLQWEDPPARVAVVDRLEAEYRAERRRHGAIRLPDPAALEPVEELWR
jgi:hypothetical protein